MEFVWGLALEWSCRCSLHGEGCVRHVRNVLHIRNGLGFFLQVGLTRAILGLRPVSQRISFSIFTLSHPGRLRVAGNKNVVLRTLQSHLIRACGWILFCHGGGVGAYGGGLLAHGGGVIYPW